MPLVATCRWLSRRRRARRGSRARAAGLHAAAGALRAELRRRRCRGERRVGAGAAPPHGRPHARACDHAPDVLTRQSGRGSAGRRDPRLHYRPRDLLRGAHGFSQPPPGIGLVAPRRGGGKRRVLCQRALRDGATAGRSLSPRARCKCMTHGACGTRGQGMNSHGVHTGNVRRLRWDAASQLAAVSLTLAATAHGRACMAHTRAPWSGGMSRSA